MSEYYLRSPGVRVAVNTDPVHIKKVHDMLVGRRIAKMNKEDANLIKKEMDRAFWRSPAGIQLLDDRKIK